MCQPVTASTVPALSSLSISPATARGARPPSTTRSRTSRPSMPPPAFTSSAASSPQASQDGPTIAAGPLRGTTKATSSVSRAMPTPGPARCPVSR